MNLFKISNERNVPLVFIVGSFFVFSMLLFPLFYSSANQGDGKISGNLNYRAYVATGTTSYFAPNDLISWTTSADVLSQTSGGSICYPQCFSEQLQLFNTGSSGGTVNYQEALIETSNGAGTCAYTECNYYCIANAPNYGCIAGSFYILNNDDLANSGWSEQFYTTLGSGGNVIAFWLQVNGPGVNKLFTITDSYQKPVYSLTLNIVGAYGNYPIASFTFGAGTTTYYNVIHNALYTGLPYTGETSNMKYGSMVGHGSYLTQTFST